MPITTSGDEGVSSRAAADKGRFLKEIEEALLAGDVDLAVHSAKDVPSRLPDGLALVGVPPRADPRDALVGAASLSGLPAGARVGTGSLRRRAQLLASDPELDVVGLRGNVDTRLRRLDEGAFDAIVLAAAGLARLGLARGAPLDVVELTPAAGQGCLALEARTDDERAVALGAALTEVEALECLTVERAFIERIGADCDTPVGAFAEWDGDTLTMRAFVGRADGSAWVRDTLAGPRTEPAALGRAVAERVLAAGAQELLAELTARA